MDLYQKISILGPSAQYDTCGPKDFGQTTDIPGVYLANLGGGRVCRLFKVLQTNSCRNNCRYCAFRRDRDCRRTSVAPSEMAKAFLSAYSRRLVEGLFLSSGILKNPDFTMVQMINTATILRGGGYRGYLHLKIMPGSSIGVIAEALRLASRVSLNLESPTQNGLAALSADKDLGKDILYTLSLIKNERRKWRFKGKKPPSLTTQFVVGAAGETDKDLIRSAYSLYKNFSLNRAFYSAFRPVPQTPLAQKPATPLIREHRLYQADFLMRFYHFTPWEIPLDKMGNLFATVDPKMIWAQAHPEVFPINLNQAGYWQLLKIPGIGPRSAKKILQTRRKQRIYSLSQLTYQRLQIQKMSAFICLS